MNPTCPSCNVEFDLSGICPQCGYDLVQNGQPHQAGAADPIVTATRRAQGNGTAQVVISIDRTGSSGRFAAGVGQAVSLLLRHAQSQASDVKCWVRSVGDLDFGEDTILLTDGGSAEDAEKAAHGINFRGGGDPKETHLDGIAAAIDQTPWTVATSNQVSVLVVFATSDTKPSRDRRTAKDLGRLLRERDIATFLIAEPFPWAWELAKAARGELFPISNSPDPALMARIGTSIGRTVAKTLSAPKQNAPA